MQAIDINAGTSATEIAGLEQGDARLLRNPDHSIDFILVPMLLGPSRACATPIEIAFCLLEFFRTLRPGGFVHLADPQAEPTVLFAAQTVGLDSFCSRRPLHGVPIGILLRIPGHDRRTERFNWIFELLQGNRVVLAEQFIDEVLPEADLLCG
ncbi:MAG: hypothetical protein ABSD56_07770 [Bryobacteraceae bacterium]